VSPFLHRCQCSRGFFVLRPCDAQAAHTCPACGRAICDEHWSAAAVPARCLECVARADERRVAGDDYDPLWAHSYRHHYYVSTGYRPFYFGQRDPYYDDYDLRAFNQPAKAAADDESAERDARDLAAGGGLDDS
jgi:hypothetical protein